MQDYEKNHVLDWQAIKAITWAIAEKILSAPPNGWQDMLIWSGWPEPKAIDATKAVDAKIKSLAAGLTTYEDELGPRWQDKLMQRSTEKKFVFDKGLRVTDVYGPL